MFDATCIDKYGNTITYLTQWDLNQTLYIEDHGFTNPPQFHFCNKNSEKALVVESAINEGILEVDVPNILLIEPYTITAYVYLTDGDSSKTVEYVQIPVRQRPQPNNFEYKDNIEIINVKELADEIRTLNATISIAEDARVEAENIRVSNETSRIEAESIRSDAENTRNTNETTRQTNEENRINSEILRDEAEATREANENIRKTNESSRINNESTRQSNETVRKNAETVRSNSEIIRQNNETTRKTNEEARITAESQRDNSELARITAEDIRITSENERIEFETERNESESIRKTNELTRQSNEINRVTSETARDEAETIRESNESTRKSNETTRKSNEDIRVSNETDRKNAESTRNTNETNRIENEDARISSENTRNTNETTRQTQENARQTNTSTAIANAETATLRANNAAKSCEDIIAGTGLIASSEKGAVNGVAELDSTGKVPSSQLPSFVDDVIEGYYYNGKFYKESAHVTSITGESGKIYIDLYTEKTYRWSGTTFVVVSETLALGETSSTAYRGDRGKTAYDHSQSTHARTDATKVAKSSTNGNILINDTETTVYIHPSGTNPHGTTKSDVGLGNVPNVDTNDQTPSYTEASSLTKLSSGEKLSVAFSKISKAITDLISHIGDSVKHITSTERTNWNLAKTHADSAHAPSCAQANVIETVKVNGNALTPNSKAVDVTVPTNNNQLTNGAGYITSSGTAKTISDTLPISKGGTGSTDAATARTNLEITPANIGALATSGGIVTGDINLTPESNVEAAFVASWNNGVTEFTSKFSGNEVSLFNDSTVFRPGSVSINGGLSSSSITTDSAIFNNDARVGATTYYTGAIIRNIVIVNRDPGEGTSVSYPNGTIIFSKV